MNSTAEKLSVVEKIGYSLGDLAANLIFQTLVTFIVFFYVDVYGIPAGTASFITFFLRLGCGILQPNNGYHCRPNRYPLG